MKRAAAAGVDVKRMRAGLNTPQSQPPTTRTTAARGAGSVSFLGWLDTGAPDLVEGVEQLASDGSDQLHRYFGLFDGNHGSVEVVARAARQRVHFRAGRVVGLIRLPDGLCNDVPER